MKESIRNTKSRDELSEKSRDISENMFHMIFDIFLILHFPCVAAWGTKFSSREKLYLFNWKLKFMQ